MVNSCSLPLVNGSRSTYLCDVIVNIIRDIDNYVKDDNLVVIGKYSKVISNVLIDFGYINYSFKNESEINIDKYYPIKTDSLLPLVNDGIYLCDVIASIISDIDNYAENSNLVVKGENSNLIKNILEKFDYNVYSFENKLSINFENNYLINTNFENLFSISRYKFKYK